MEHIEKKHPPFGAVFTLYTPPAALKEVFAGAHIHHMRIESESRGITLSASFDVPVSHEALSALEAGISKAYGLSELTIVEVLSAFTPAEAPLAIGYLKRKHVSINGFFKDAQVEIVGNDVTFHLSCSSLPFATEEVERVLGDFLFFAGISGMKCHVALASDFSGEAFDRDMYAKMSDEVELIRKNAPAAPAAAPKAEPAQKRIFAKKPRPKTMHPGETLLGKPFGDELVPLSEITPNSEYAAPGVYTAAAGKVFFVERKDFRNGTSAALTFDITDKTSSLRLKKLINLEKDDGFIDKIKTGMYLYVRGTYKYDRFNDDYVMDPISVMVGEETIRPDLAEKKRVELHLHTQMSQMDGVSSATDLIARAKYWGHPAIAITDHGVAQAYPEAAKAAKKFDFKVIYGCEGYYINNQEDVTIVRGDKDESLDGYFICFDLETTGTKKDEDGITEIAASLVHNDTIIDNFHTYVNPERPIPPFITELTGITNAMVASAPKTEEAVRAFLEFAKGYVCVAHNAAFDTGFIAHAAEKYGLDYEPTSIDTVEMSRILMPHLERHKLNVVAEALKLPKFKHHTASDDTKTLALMFVKLKEMAKETLGVTRVAELDAALNDRRRENTEKAHYAKSLPVRHILFLAKNKVGLKNLYKLISKGHLEHMNSRKQPIIPRHELARHREGLLVGSACEAGELFAAVAAGASHKELIKIAKFYDFLEIQPIGNNEFMLRNGEVPDRATLENFNKTIVQLGDELGIPVVATCDVHFLDKEDEVYRRILMAGKGFSDADDQAPLYFRNTEEMLAEFSYLPPKKAFEVVVTNTNLIADMCESFRPLPKEMFAPVIENSAEDLQRIVLQKAHSIYGDDLPEVVQKRLDRELGCIISNSYDVMYMTAQKLIKGSNDRGYIVGSRGSVGSSVVAFMAGITEVNSLPAHYVCPNCHHSDWDAPSESIGADLPDKNCPICGTKYLKDGFNIPFETFLGFEGDKVPDIDLNFSGEDQANAHAQVIELFGKENVFRAGTIGTIAEKTAFGYVKKYFDERPHLEKPCKAEEYRLVLGCTGVKRTTGQHPGGMIVVPRTSEIYDFCAIQHPADDTESDTVTTHIDYHTMEDNLLKFDILGHDDPTMIRMLTDLTGFDARKVPLDDKPTLSLYSTHEALHIEADDIIGETGSIAVPEYGTKFVRQMLVDTMPSTIGDLIRISGLSHGTDVWLGNAKDLIASGTTDITGTICCRDDIMIYLISMGMDPKLSFTIMESVRKGRKLKPEWIPIMRENNVPEWYIESCNKIKYLFPKAHAAAYVVNGFRIAYYKVHYPLAFYAAYFTIRAAALDAEAMLMGDAHMVEFIRRIEGDKSAAAIDQELAKTFEVTHEYYLRGFEFLPPDIYKSDATHFTIEDGKLRFPFSAIRGLGENAAKGIVSAREDGEFTSVEDIISRSHISRTNADQLKALGVFGDIPDSEQISFF
ncbi:MAG: PolC-type DNA polymerase III [Clostridia bacterium]|nr:PolC-type DNA polymerase III [Clostridia bacterium]